MKYSEMSRIDRDAKKILHRQILANVIAAANAEIQAGRVPFKVTPVETAIEKTPLSFTVTKAAYGEGGTFSAKIAWKVKGDVVKTETLAWDELPSEVLLAIYRQIATSEARHTFDTVKEALDAANEDSDTEDALDAAGIGVVANRLSETSSWSGFDDIECALAAMDVPHPGQGYLIVKHDDIQMIACKQDGRWTLLPWFLSREAGLVAVK